MEQYTGVIGVVVEKLEQTYKDLKFNYNGLDGILQSHTAEEANSSPELLTIKELRAVYAELIDRMEKRLPGLKEG